MSQLSIYDFLSFFLPGFIAVELCRLLGMYSGIALTLPIHFSDVEKGLIVLAVSLILGLFIHRLTFLAVDRKWQWYQNLVMLSIGQVAAHSDDILYIQPYLDEYCKQITGQPFFINKEKVAPYFFDHAYYVVEANEKMNVAKNLQSMYFFCRNIFTLTLIVGPLLIVFMALILLLTGMFNYSWLLITVAVIATVFISRICANFYRVKMIERIFWTYHILKKDPIKK